MKLPKALLAMSFLLCACQTMPPSTHCKQTELDCIQRFKTDKLSNTNNYSICKKAHIYAGLVVGDGHCVSLIRRCSDLGSTASWKPGSLVQGSKLPQGTIIATFAGNKYPNKTGYHAAIFIEHHVNGFWVWDQWQGMPVHKRLIRYRKDGAPASNSAQAYRVVLSNR